MGPRNLSTRRGIGVISGQLIFPDSLFIDDMYYLPSSLLQAAAYKTAVTAPGKALGAEEGRAASRCHALQ